MQIRWPWLVSLSLLAACPGGDDPGTVNGDKQQEDEDTDTCDEGLVEDGLGVCRTPCEAQEDCPDGEACQVSVGLCLPAVSVTCNPDACPEGTVCPPDGGVECVPVIEGLCESDDDCDFGFYCEDSECVSRAGEVVQTCAADAECGPLMTCQFGVCVGCLDDLQCGLGGKCVLGTCVVAELGPAGECLTLECADGSRCNPFSGVCEPTCELDDDCDEGQICAPVLNQCIADFGCEANEDCITGSCTLGLCTNCLDGPNPQAEDNCPASTNCVEAGVGSAVGISSVCLPSFDGGGDACADVTCGAQELCDPLDGSCYPEDGTCADDGDCREGHDCNFLGFCSGCSVDGDCRPDQSCIFGTCAPF